MAAQIEDRGALRWAQFAVERNIEGNAAVALIALGGGETGERERSERSFAASARPGAEFILFIVM